MTTYLLRGLDAELWTAVKTRAAREGHTVRWVIVALLMRYVRHGLTKSPLPQVRRNAHD